MVLTEIRAALRSRTALVSNLHAESTDCCTQQGECVPAADLTKALWDWRMARRTGEKTGLWLREAQLFEAAEAGRKWAVPTAAVALYSLEPGGYPK